MSSPPHAEEKPKTRRVLQTEKWNWSTSHISSYSDETTNYSRYNFSSTPPSCRTIQSRNSTKRRWCQTSIDDRQTATQSDPLSSEIRAHHEICDSIASPKSSFWCCNPCQDEFVYGLYEYWESALHRQGLYTDQFTVRLKMAEELQIKQCNVQSDSILHFIVSSSPDRTLAARD